MPSSSDRLARAFARFDAINAEDPRGENADGEEHPKELLYARRMTDRLNRFEPNASEALRLAARAQHIARWRIPRSEYPDGRKGYKQWRSRLMAHHASLAREVLEELGYEAETIERVTRMLRKQGLTRDPEVQTLEDVICLVFLEHYFDAFAEDHPEEKLIDILRKTWVKMTERGHEAALELDLSDRTAGLVARAIESEEP